MFLFFIDVLLVAAGYFLFKGILQSCNEDRVLYLEYHPTNTNDTNDTNDNEVPPRYENTNLLEPIEENQKEEPPKY